MCTGGDFLRAVVQRVSSSYVKVDDKVVGSINEGLCVLLGVAKDDTEKDIKWLADKIVNLRIFPDENGKMSKSLLDIDGEILIISQFTLYGDCKKGRRPSFDSAAPPDKGKEFYEKFVNIVRSFPLKKVATGIFGAYMEVGIVNDGPVTIVIDSKVVIKRA